MFNALTVRQQVALDTHVSNLGALKMNETIPQTGFVRIPQILSVIPISRSAWWSGVKSSKYPAPIKLGANTTVWKAEDIHALIKQIAEKGGV